jgi:hypothetical protein
MVAVVAGPLVGAAGETWRRRTGWPRALAVAPLAGTLIAEGVVFGPGRIGRLPDDPGGIVLVMEIGIGLALPALLLPSGGRLRGYIATGAFACAAVVSLDLVVDLVRGLADTF